MRPREHVLHLEPCLRVVDLGQMGEGASDQRRFPAVLDDALAMPSPAPALRCAHDGTGPIFGVGCAAEAS